MICREIGHLSPGFDWLLVSQVEHARVSAELARHWTSGNTPRRLFDDEGAENLRSEFLSGIEHHDDGWMRWEQAPQIESALGRPLTYRGEVPIEDTLVIWSDSIAGANQFGPLAGRMVARHFIELSRMSDSGDDSPVARWREEKLKLCDDWLESWAAISKYHTIAIAERAVAYLQLFDRLSLWLCCDCPLAGEARADGSTLTLTTSASESRSIRFTSMMANEGELSDHGGRFHRKVAVVPWPFDSDRFSLYATGILIPLLDPPVAWNQVLAGSSALSFGWDFVPN